MGWGRNINFGVTFFEKEFIFRTSVSSMLMPPLLYMEWCSEKKMPLQTIFSRVWQNCSEEFHTHVNM